MSDSKTHTDFTPSLGQLNQLYKVVDALIGTGEVKVVFEFGARYGEDTVELAGRFRNAMIYTFECNPRTLPALRERTKSFRNILLTENAISDQEGEIEFYQINPEKTRTTWVDGNQGASSIYKASGKYPIEQYGQDMIRVRAITLESFMVQNNIASIDVMWMDVQGAELNALKGLGNKIKDLKIVHLEVEFIEIYKGQPLFGSVDSYLKKSGFDQLGFTSKTHYSGDVVYVNRRHFKQSAIDSAAALVPEEEKNFSYYLAKMLFRLKYWGFKATKSLAKK